MPLNKQCIQNVWEKGSGPLFESFNPATGISLWKGNSAGPDDVDKACEAASKAFETWSTHPINERIEYLYSFRDELEDEKNNLALLISQETGKPLWESKGEVESMIAKIAISISAYQARCPNVTLPKAAQVIKTFHKPHGVAVVLGPFNFPGHLPNGHIIPALLAGNTVIFKPSELTPATGEAIMTIWQKSGLPKGVLNLLQGGKETGSLLAEHAKINALFFTGSWETGKWLSEKFAPHPEKILALEMGGNNPLIIDTIQDIRAAAYLTIQSAFITAGQRCSCARRLIVLQGSAGDAFITELLDMTAKIQIGAYDSSPEPFMGPVINGKAAEKLLQKQDALIQLGGKPLLLMKQINPALPFLTPGIIDIADIDRVPDEEIFGPLLLITRAKNLHEAIAKANQTAYGLCAGIFSDVPEHFDVFYQGVRAGIINWNTPTTGASSAAPFGGIGRSGNHRPSAYYAADYCSYPVASTESYPLQKPPKTSPGIAI
ncbi:MAG: succinylglutamate-semialdehyde dehydrogenase [Parachlamydia sp.]|nr:MAG: succinylglutamate-semialdehyde dehydrogenase [Parachlamydia sp.]